MNNLNCSTGSQQDLAWSTARKNNCALPAPMVVLRHQFTPQTGMPKENSDKPAASCAPVNQPPADAQAGSSRRLPAGQPVPSCLSIRAAFPISDVKLFQGEKNHCLTCVSLAGLSEQLRAGLPCLLHSTGTISAFSVLEKLSRRVLFGHVSAKQIDP
eukprot:1162070-Pelagomonas_calceolata.AAC.3